MIKLIAFDWNGTLLSDTYQTYLSNNYTFAKVGLKPISLLKFKQTFDVPIMNIYISNGMSKPAFLKVAEKQSKIYHEYYEKQVTKVRTRGGVRALLLWLQKNSIDSIIYSNRTHSGINFQLKRLKIEKLISKTLANDHGHQNTKTRSKDLKLFEYIKSKKYKPNEVISIGDTEEEIEIGKKFGFHTVALTGGYQTTAKLKKKEARLSNP